MDSEWGKDDSKGKQGNDARSRHCLMQKTGSYVRLQEVTGNLPEIQSNNKGRSKWGITKMKAK